MDILEILLRDSLDLLDRLFIVEVFHTWIFDETIVKVGVIMTQIKSENIEGREDPQRKAKTVVVERTQT